MQPFQCDLQAQIPKHPITTHTQAHPKQLEATVTMRQKKKGKPTAAATAAQTRYLSSPAAATLHGKTQGFVPRLPPQNIAHATFMQPLQCDLQPPFIKVKSQSHTTLQGQVSIAQHPSRSSLNPICNHPSSRSCEVSHHPSRSSLNRPPPFKVKSQSPTTLQDQVSIAHHPSRSSLNRAPPFKVKSQSHTTLHTTLQGQVSIAHHPFSIARHPSRSSLNPTPPFKVKSQSHTTPSHHPSKCQSRTIAHHPSRSSLNRTPPFKVKCSIAHHPSSFQDSEFYLSVPRKYCFPTSFDYTTTTITESNMKRVKPTCEIVQSSFLPQVSHVSQLCRESCKLRARKRH